MIEEKCRFLSNFNQRTAEVDLPGELLLPRHSHYHVKIARFMPRVEIVQKHNTSARRLFIRGTNGKVSYKEICLKIIVRSAAKIRMKEVDLADAPPVHWGCFLKSFGPKQVT